jgi:hypothetical protein
VTAAATPRSPSHHTPDDDHSNNGNAALQKAVPWAFDASTDSAALAQKHCLSCFLKKCPKLMQCAGRDCKQSQRKQACSSSVTSAVTNSFMSARSLVLCEHCKVHLLCVHCSVAGDKCRCWSIRPRHTGHPRRSSPPADLKGWGRACSIERSSEATDGINPFYCRQ